MARLTPGMMLALETLERRADEGHALVSASRRNGPNYIASGTAEALVDRGLADRHMGYALTFSYSITDAGREALARGQ